MGRGRRGAALTVRPRPTDLDLRSDKATGRSVSSSETALRPSDELIRETWEQADHNVRETARRLDRPYPTVRRWLVTLGLYQVAKQEIKVTQADAVAAVKRLGAVKAAALEYGVTSTSISKHLTKAGENLLQPRPTDEEIRAAWQQSGGHPPTTALLLDRSEKATRGWLVELGLYQPRDRKRWSKRDLARLKRDYPRYRRQGRLAELAEELGTTRAGLAVQAKKMLLTDPSLPRPWTWELKALSDDYVDELIAELAEYNDTSAEWQRANKFSEGLMKEIRERRPHEYKRAKDSAAQRHGQSTAAKDKKLEVSAQKEIERYARRAGLRHFIVRGHDLSYGAGDLGVIGYGKHYEIQSEVHGDWPIEKWNRLFGWCRMQGAIPLVVRQGKNGKPEYFEVIGKKTGERGKRQPMVPWDWEQEFARLKAHAARLEASFND